MYMYMKYPYVHILPYKDSFWLMTNHKFASILCAFSTVFPTEICPLLFLPHFEPWQMMPFDVSVWQMISFGEKSYAAIIMTSKLYFIYSPCILINVYMYMWKYTTKCNTGYFDQSSLLKLKNNTLILGFLYYNWHISLKY